MSEMPRYWRTQAERYRMVGEVCPNLECEKPVIFPPRDVCPTCKTSTKKDGVPLKTIEYQVVYQASSASSDKDSLSSERK